MSVDISFANLAILRDVLRSISNIECHETSPLHVIDIDKYSDDNSPNIDIIRLSNLAKTVYRILPK